jgi:hypothetical protein
MESLAGAPESTLMSFMQEVPTSSYTMDDGTKLARWHWRPRDGDMTCTIMEDPAARCRGDFAGTAARIRPVRAKSWTRLVASNSCSRMFLWNDPLSA